MWHVGLWGQSAFSSHGMNVSASKIHHGFERMRLRGLSGARDEFHLAAIVQNLKTLALRSIGPPVTPQPASVA
jgi:hypothetical protein